MNEMNAYLFIERAKLHFRYLLDDYDFSVINERRESEPFGNSLVQFRSRTGDMVIVLDRGQVLIDIGPYPSSAECRFGLTSVVKYLAPEINEPTYFFPETWENYHDMIEWQLRRLAHLLRRTCSRVLTGEFSQWSELAEAQSNAADSGYRALTGTDPIEMTSEELGKKIRKEERKRARRAQSSGA